MTANANCHRIDWKVFFSLFVCHLDEILSSVEHMTHCETSRMTSTYLSSNRWLLPIEIPKRLFMATIFRRKVSACGFRVLEFFENCSSKNEHETSSSSRRVVYDSYMYISISILSLFCSWFSFLLFSYCSLLVSFDPSLFFLNLILSQKMFSQTWDKCTFSNTPDLKFSNVYFFFSPFFFSKI